MQFHSQYTCAGAVHRFSDEVLLQRAIAFFVVGQSDVPVRREGSRSARGLSFPQDPLAVFHNTHNTVMYPNIDSNGLSRMLLILYSKFCAATSGFRRFRQNMPFKATISPQAPPTDELMSNAFHKW